VLTNDFPAIAAFVRQMTGAAIPTDASGIGWTRDGEIVCAAMYDHYTGRSITASIAKAPGAVMPPGFIRIIFDYPFKQLGCAKILAYIEDVNWKSKELVEKMGFVLEATVTDVFPSGSMMIYTMLADQCRWLENEDGQEHQDPRST
jgi:hypothetical protein